MQVYAFLRIQRGAQISVERILVMASNARKNLKRLATVRRKETSKKRPCMNPECLTGALAIKSHQVSESQLRQIHKNKKVVLARPVEEKSMFNGVFDLFEESYIASALKFYGFCPICDQQLFIEVDNPNEPFSDKIIHQQSFRSLCYQIRYDEIEYETLFQFYAEKGRIRSSIPALPSIDPRIATTLDKEWEYYKTGYKYYISELQNAINGNAGNIAVFSTEIVESMPFRYTSATHLNVDFFGVSLGLNWNNAGIAKPLIFWQVLQYNGKTHLSCCMLAKHQSYGHQIFNQIKTLSPNIRLAHFFRYASHNNLGLTLDPNEYARVCNFQEYLDDISADYEEIRKHGTKRNWETYTTPGTFGSMTFI